MLGGTADRTSVRRTTEVLVLGSPGSHHGFDNAVLTRSFDDCRCYRDGTAAHDQDTLERNAPDDDTNNKHRSLDHTMCLNAHKPVGMAD